MAKVRIKLSFKPSPGQREVDASKARFRIVKAGRRFGKTHYAIYWLLKRALAEPGSHWYVGKTMKLVRDVGWPLLMKMVAELPEGVVKSSSRNPFRLILRSSGGEESIIAGVSAEKEDNLRGAGVKSLVVDEASFLRPSAWALVLRPMLADTMGYALLISSPKMGWFTRQFNDAKAGKLNDWEAFHYTIYDNPRIDRKEIEEIRNTVREDAWLQEYMAEDFEGGGVVYPMFQDSSIKVLDRNFPGYRSYPCVVGLDWGWNDATAAVWVHVDPVSGHLYVSQVHQKSQWEVERHAPIIERNSQGLDVKAYVLDTSAFRKEGGARLSVADKFKANNIHVVRSEKNLDSSIDTLSGFLRGNENGPFIHIDPSCEYVIRGLQDWELKQHEPDALAALRYAVVKACQMKMTNLSDLMPKATARKLQTLTPGAIFLDKRKPMADQWTWDSQRGRPSLG